MEQFIEALNTEFSDRQPENKNLHAVLSLCCSLYGVWCIERDGSFFIVGEYISLGKAKAIKKQVNKLCDELTPHLPSLTNGFGVPTTTPDNLNYPPIGKGFMEFYTYDNYKKYYSAKM